MPITIPSWFIIVEYVIMAGGLAVLAWFGVTRILRPVEGALGFWAVDGVTFLQCTLIVIAGMTAALALGTTFLGGEPTSDFARILLGGMFPLGALAAVLGCRLWWGAKVGNHASVPWHGSVALAGMATFAAALPLVVLTGEVWQWVLTHSGVTAPRQELVEMLARDADPATRAVFIVLAVAVAPLAEELVFRAGLFRYLRGRTPRLVTWLLPAMIFASAHGYVAVMPQLTVLGLAFAIAYERTGRIAVPVIAHALFNLNTVATVLLSGGSAS